MKKILRDDDDFLLEAVSQVSRFRFLKLVLATMLPLLVNSFYPSCADVFFFFLNACSCNLYGSNCSSVKLDNVIVSAVEKNSNKNEPQLGIIILFVESKAAKLQY